MSDEKNNKKNQDGVAAESVADSMTTVAQERDEYLNGWKRAKADLINFKKEEDRRLREVVAFATLGFVKDLLTGMDTFDLALHSTQNEEVRKEIAMIKGQFDELLKRQGVTRIVVRVGVPPDPRLHEAIQEVELSEDKKELGGKIIGELVAGYMMGERVIRASKVSVGKL